MSESELCSLDSVRCTRDELVSESDPCCGLDPVCCARGVLVSESCEGSTFDLSCWSRDGDLTSVVCRRCGLKSALFKCDGLASESWASDEDLISVVACLNSACFESDELASESWACATFEFAARSRVALVSGTCTRDLFLISESCPRVVLTCVLCTRDAALASDWRPRGSLFAPKAESRTRRLPNSCVLSARDASESD